MYKGVLAEHGCVDEGVHMHVRTSQGWMEPKVGRRGPGPEAWGHFSLPHRLPAQASEHPQYQPGLGHYEGLCGKVG